MTSFGAQLRKIRMERGISVNKLAENIGFCRLTIYRWEKGVQAPKSFETIHAIADFFHISPNYFSALGTNTVTREDIAKLRSEVSNLRAELNSLRQLVMMKI